MSGVGLFLFQTLPPVRFCRFEAATPLRSLLFLSFPSAPRLISPTKNEKLETKKIKYPCLDFRGLVDIPYPVHYLPHILQIRVFVESGFREFVDPNDVFEFALVKFALNILVGFRFFQDNLPFSVFRFKFL